MFSYRNFKYAVLTFASQFAIMTAPSSYWTDDSNASNPTFEDITELCNFCVELTAVMVKRRLPPEDHRSFEDFRPDPDPKTCRLCKMISRDLSAPKPEWSPFTLANLKKLEMWWGWSAEGQDVNGL